MTTRGIALVAILAVAAVRPAGAATEITAGGAQYVPAVTVVGAGTSVAFVNMEPADYPVLLGRHNVIGDSDVGGTPATRPFPVSSPLLRPGQRWTCAGVTAGISCIGADRRTITVARGTYAFRCGLHPNQMRGILVIR